MEANASRTSTASTDATTGHSRATCAWYIPYILVIKLYHKIIDMKRPIYLLS